MFARLGKVMRSAAVLAGLVAGLPFAAAAAEESSGAAPVVPPVAPLDVPAAVSDTAAAAEAAAAALPGTAFSWGNYFEAVGILFVMLAVLWGVLWFVRRRGGGGVFGGGANGLRIESRVALGPKKWILTATFRDRCLIIGVTDHQISLIADYPANAEVAAEPGAQGQSNAGKTLSSVEAADFSTVLRRSTEAAGSAVEG